MCVAIFVVCVMEIRFFAFLLLPFFFFSSITSQNCPNNQYKNVQIITPSFPISSCNHSILRIGASISNYYQDFFYYPSVQMLNGWKLFVEWVNYERHGIIFNNQSYLLELIYIEDYSSGEAVIENTIYLLDHYQVDFIYAPYSTPLTAATASITDVRNISVFAAGAPLPSIFEQTDYVYGLLPAASSYSEGAFRAFSQFGAHSIAVIADNDVTVCNNESSIFFAQLYNITLYGFYSVNSSHPEYNQTIKEILTDLKENNVETVFGCSFTNLCELIITYSKQIDYNPFGIMLSLCIINPTLFDLGEDLAYVFALAPWASTSKIYDQYTNWTAADFDLRYYETFGSNPTYLSAASFASGEVLLATIETLNSFDHLIFKDHLLSSYFPTLYGNITFNSLGQSDNDMFVVQVMPETQDIEIVLPSFYADRVPYFPAPTWLKRQCEIDTNYCSSHGTCSSTGICICDYGYYGFENLNSCDTYCVGTFNSETGGCAKFTTYYVGVILDYQFLEYEEYLAHVTLAAEMINNKTDGWFDDILNVHLILNQSNTGCDYNVAVHAAEQLNLWAMSVNNNNYLDGMIGGYCSSASAGASIYNNAYATTQVSYGSTSESLSDKDMYEYFSRTCGSDSAQGPSLARTLAAFGIVPYIAVVHTDDSYAVSLANSFSTSYEGDDNFILLSYSYNSESATSSTYITMIDELAKSGAPAIVLVVYQDEIEKILNVASTHPILSSTEVLWIGVDAWIGASINTTNLPAGTIGLAPNHYNGNITERYYEVWRNLDPLQYPDSNLNRNDVATYSLQAADAVFALANAYELSLHDNTGLTGASLRAYIFSSLIGQVSFQGVSGAIDFSASGDLIDPIFRIIRYKGYESTEHWEDVGTVDSTGVLEINYTQLVWPDGSAGITSSYSKQLSPYCGAGEEPIVASDGISTCTPCEVGYYKPLPGRESCLNCPEGADCNDVGITIPCILKGYWRAEPNNPIDLSDFKKYPIYTCDFSQVCHGGCQLNHSCQYDRKQSSPVCGVCEKGYYMSDKECYTCSSNQSENRTIQTVIYVLVGVGSLFLLFSVLVFTISFNLASTKSSNIEIESTPSESEIQPRKTDFRRKSIATLQNMSRSVSKSILTPAIAMLTHQANQRKVKKVIKGSGMTAKITLSFLQVMTGSFYMLNLNLPSYFKVFFDAIRINPFRPIQASFSCENESTHYLIHPFYVGTIFCVLIPLIFILLILTAAFIAWKVFILTKGNEINDIERHRQWKRLRDLTIKIYFWFCLISYPPLSQRILSFYNCRNLGPTGNFLRADYTVSCDSKAYHFFFYIAILGTFLVPIGVPVLFSLVVHYRSHPLLHNPSLLLHDNFVSEWRYFEAYDLIRKLTLTSLVVYVAPPDTASQCLFLLIIDGTALLLLAYSRPYANGNDDFLSGVLVAVECISFFVATVIISGISSEDHYNVTTLYNTLFAFILLSMVCIVPWTLAMKFKAVSTRVDKFFEIIMKKSENYGLSLPALTRLDSRRRMLHEVEEMRESIQDIRSSLTDLSQIELMYRDPDEEGDEEEYHTTESITRPGSGGSTGSLGTSSAKNPIHTGSLTKNPKDLLMKKRESDTSMMRFKSQRPELEMVVESDEVSSHTSSYPTEFVSNEENEIHNFPIPSTPTSTLTHIPPPSHPPPPIPSSSSTLIRPSPSPSSSLSPSSSPASRLPKYALPEHRLSADSDHFQL